MLTFPELRAPWWLIRLYYTRGRHFPGAVIAHAVWLYLRFPLSFRDVEELLAERGIRVSYETVRRWVGARLEVQRSSMHDATFSHSHPLMLMTTPSPAGPVPPGQLLRASLPAAMLGLLLAVALKFTTLSPGVATGMSIATFFIAQAVLLQRGTGRRNSPKGWVMVLLLALAAALASGLIMELQGTPLEIDVV